MIGTVLFVDSEESTLLSLKRFLNSSDFFTLFASTGEDALDIANEKLPDLILVDISMPHINGIEICKKLKGSDRTKDISIMFITNKSSSRDIVNGFDAGGVDYIAKPINPIELIARVNVHLELKKTKDALRDNNLKLEFLVEERTKDLEEKIDLLNETQNKLIESEKNNLLISLVATITHEIKNPLGISITAASFLDEKIKDLSTIFNSNKITKKYLTKYIESTIESSRMIMSNLDNAVKLVDSFKDMSVDQASGIRREIDLKDYLEEIIFTLKPKLKRTNHSIVLECEEGLIFFTYPGVISQIFSNLIINSLIHGFEDITDGVISIKVSSADYIKIIYNDNGKGMTEEVQRRIFDPFYSTKMGSGGSGLGMNIVYNLVKDKLNGNIEINKENKDETEFIISIPKE